MPSINPRGELERRLWDFVSWIAPEEATEEKIQRQAQSLRTQLSARATRDGLVIQSTPNSGSFAKRTGLRRHMADKQAIEGLDVDLPFVISPRTQTERDIQELLRRFYAYAHAEYPSASKRLTKSSVHMDFVDAKLSFDLVPLLATQNPERQFLLRQDGEWRETSVQKHIDFVKTRTDASNRLGRVKFNECVRLVKWWREVRQSQASNLVVPSILIDLLCAHAFDSKRVQETYAGTLAEWFGLMAHAVRNRKPIAFNDFGPAPASLPAGTLWAVLDPLNASNNIVSTWNANQLDTFAGWLEQARDAWARAITSEHVGDSAGSLQALIDIFGITIKHYAGTRA